MFRKARRGDLPRVMEFLEQEEAINHYLLADLEWLGLDYPLLELFLQEEDGVRAVLLRYGVGFTIYAPGDFDDAAVAQQIQRYRYAQLSGETPAVRRVMAHLAVPVQVTHQIFSVWNPAALRTSPREIPLVWAGDGNIRCYVHQMEELRGCIPEFTQPFSVERTIAQCRQKSQRSVLALQEGKAISMAMTSGERRRTAMIVGVCTHPGWRGRGYAPALVYALSCRLLSEGKTPLLFWETPQAGRIYHDLGYEDRGEWRIVRY